MEGKGCVLLFITVLLSRWTRYAVSGLQPYVNKCNLEESYKLINADLKRLATDVGIIREAMAKKIIPGLKSPYQYDDPCTLGKDYKTCEFRQMNITSRILVNKEILYKFSKSLRKMIKREKRIKRKHFQSSLRRLLQQIKILFPQYRDLKSDIEKCLGVPPQLSVAVGPQLIIPYPQRKGQMCAQTRDGQALSLLKLLQLASTEIFRDMSIRIMGWDES